MTIKPEDIPEEMRCRGHLSADFIAAVLNSAIEAGVASPPCHCIKHETGYVIDPGYHRDIRIWPGKAYGPNIEHWKGQTE